MASSPASGCCSTAGFFFFADSVRDGREMAINARHPSIADHSGSDGPRLAETREAVGL